MTQTQPAPITAADLLKAYVPVITYVGGATGDDVDQATANATLDYAPRTQAAKAALMVPAGSLAIDIARPRGVTEPLAPYPVAATPAPVAPVVTSISPTTAAAATLPLTVTITGTGFTPWSVVKTGGSNTADVSGKYVDATHMKVAIFAAAPGTVSVAVEDHDVLSNTDKLFTVT